MLSQKAFNVERAITRIGNTIVPIRDFFKLFTGAGGGDLTDYTDLFGSDLEVVNAGQAAQSSLLTEESATGDAYQGLRESVDRSRPDMTDNPRNGS